MKKIAIIIASLAVMLHSCKSKDNEYNPDYYVVLITSVESTEVGKVPVKWDLIYANTNSSTPVTDYRFTAAPILLQQKITGGGQNDISQVNYSFSKTAVTVETISSIETTKDSIRFGGNSMASDLYVNEIPSSYYITYDSEGFITKVGDVRLISNDKKYTRATNLEGDLELARYEYTDYPNLMGLKQYGMYGSDYFWPTNRFGNASTYLLRKFYRVEDGQEVVYNFQYSRDSNGVVTKEEITRNTQPFLTVEYKYAIGSWSKAI